MTQFKLGDVEILCLNDASAPFAEGELPVSFPGVEVADFEPFRERFPDTFTGDTWFVRFCGIVIRTPGLTVLVDTGLGRRPDPYWGVEEGRLLANLEAAGMEPSDIDVVLLTHLHADHVGWNVSPNGSPTFPRARYVAQQSDWKAFREPPLDTAFPFEYLDRDVYSLESLGVLDIVDGEHRLSDEILALPAPGHTPGHMVVRVDAGDTPALIMGDSVLHPAQVTYPEWPFVFDLDREHAARTRRGLIDTVEDEEMLLVACHFPEPHYGQVVREGNERHWRPGADS